VADAAGVTILDQVFQGKAGGDLLFTAGVEVGRVKGREEICEYLIRKFLMLKEGSQVSFGAFVRQELVNFQREHS
jgi:hypothetical protein